MVERELSRAELTQQDALEGACYQLVCDLVGEKLEWDMAWISPLAESVSYIVCEQLKLRTYEEFYPYVDSWEDGELGEVKVYHKEKS